MSSSIITLTELKDSNILSLIEQFVNKKQKINKMAKIITIFLKNSKNLKNI